MEGNSIRSYENLCKIFETRIKLDKEKNIDTPEDVLINYEKYAKKIDNIYNKEFEDNIKPLISPASDLDREKNRLEKLIRLLEDRLKKREELENRFYLATGKYFNDLQIVISESELNDKRNRLDLINKYLDTDKEIKSITESIAKLRNSLEEEETRKEDYLVKNKIMEEELNNSFMDIIKNDEYFANLSVENIDTIFVEVIDKVKETSETLEVTKDSVESLMENGVSDDYASYIEDAERNYYIWKNREIILKIYEKIVVDEIDFNEILTKREKIDELVRERNSIRINLNINDTDEFYSFSKILLEQMDNLDGEREILENVANYSSRIKFKEERLDELEEDINSVEMLSILREYKLIDTYESNNLTEDTEDIVIPKEEDIVLEEINPYRIVEVKDYPKTLNVGLAKLKAESVRDKINKKLNPKEEEFNSIPAENITPSIDTPTAEELVVDNTKTSKEENSISDDSSSNENIFIEDDKDTKLELPTWKIPNNEEVTNSNTSPMWEDVNTNNDSLPVWGETDIKDNNLPAWDSTENSIPQVNTPSENLFWTPVNDTPSDDNSFVKIPFNNDSSVFDFPNLNN